MIQAVVRPDKEESIASALAEANFPALTKWDVVGRGRQRGIQVGDQVYDELGKSMTGGIIFPIGFVMIVLLGLELVTGNFALVPLGVISGKIAPRDLAANWTWVFVGNLLGGLAYALLFLATTKSGNPVADRIV